jgi:hypothetical protein
MSNHRSPQEGESDRKARLARELRTNLARRKMQARARRDGQPAAEAQDHAQSTEAPQGQNGNAVPE